MKINISYVTGSYIDPDYAFTYIKNGWGIFVLEGTEYKVKPGDLILMPPYMFHIVRPDKGEELVQYIIHFDAFFTPERITDITLEKNMDFAKFRENKANLENILAFLPHFLELKINYQLIIEEIFLAMKNEFEKKQQAYELVEKAKMLEIIAIYLRNSSRRNIGSTKNMKNWCNIEKAIKFIHRNYDRSIALAELSNIAGLSLNYFCNVFIKYTGVSPHYYINKFRIHKAKELIEESSLNFTQIAEQVGFSSIHVFSKVFKRIENTTLTEYSSKPIDSQ
ncbi:MAG: AraC family transcriptional regulator [Victivallaceae bacterium]|nr:AraC family transcriptional regulator [Victivallaceae bacterium]